MTHSDQDGQSRRNEPRVQRGQMGRADQDRQDKTAGEWSKTGMTSTGSSSAKRRTGKDRPLYMISVAAELTGMHPQTLRIYESKGLVSPQRSNGNTRLYSQADIERLELIGRITDEGINLAGAVRILDMRSQIEELNQEVEDLRAQLKSLRDQVREYRTRETITTLTRYEGTNDVQGFLSRLLEETSGDSVNQTPGD